MKELLPLRDLNDVARHKPEGYAKRILELGTVEGEFIRLSPESWLKIRLEFKEKQQEQQAAIYTERAKYSNEPPLPSLGAMAVNAGTAAAKAFGAAVTGQAVLRSEELATKLLEVCETSGTDGGNCEWFRPSDNRCGHSKCGCYLDPAKTAPPSKTRLATATCPIGKWKIVLDREAENSIDSSQDSKPQQTKAKEK